jgi:putative flippase GtrA
MIRKLPWAQLIKFGITGGIAFAIDFAIYFGLTRFAHMPYLLSRTISLGVAMIWNFLANRYWTFRATTGHMGQQAVRFLIVMGITSLLNLWLMHLGVSVLHLHDLVVMVAASLIIMVINFCAHRLWSYRG